MNDQRIDDRIKELLDLRRQKNEYRELRIDPKQNTLVDFASNDYLGLSRSAWVSNRVQSEKTDHYPQSGSTGSRLLTGNSLALESLEQKIADFHTAESALLFNSGYAANEGLISTLCRRGDVILFDSAVHASIRQGICLSQADNFMFRHNDIDGLKTLLLEHQNKMVFVVLESVYSMDGDHAPLTAIADLKKSFIFELIVDEAHALGVFGKQGRGLCEAMNVESHCTARIYTFGKALGCHGAVVVGSQLLKEYLVNFCKQLIYTTAPDQHFSASVEHRYDYLLKFDNQQNRLVQLINKFKYDFTALESYEISGNGPVFALICGSALRCRALAKHLNEAGFDVRPIVYPTVEKGRERIRISLHSFNSEHELDELLKAIKNFRE